MFSEMLDFDKTHQRDVMFLLFMIIVISSVVYRLSNATLVLVMSVALILFCFHKSELHSAADRCAFPPTQDITYVSKQLADIKDNDPTDPPAHSVYEAANKYNKTGHEFEKQLYTDLDATEHRYYDAACPGDNLLSLRMWENGKRSKMAMDNRAKFDKYSILHYFDEELRTTSNSVWWDDDSLEHLF